MMLLCDDPFDNCANAAPESSEITKISAYDSVYDIAYGWVEEASYVLVVVFCRLLLLWSVEMGSRERVVGLTRALRSDVDVDVDVEIRLM